MNKNKIKSYISKNWKILLILFFILILELINLYFQDVISYLTFNKNAEDLVVKGEQGLYEVFKYTFSFDIKYEEFTRNRFKIVTLLIVFIGVLYLNIKEKSIKYLIGKNENIKKILLKKKLKLALIPSIYYLVMACIIQLIHWITFTNKELSVFLVKIKPESILRQYITSELSMLIFQHIVIVITTYIITLLCINIIELLGKFKGTMAVFILILIIHNVVNSILRIFTEFSISTYSPAYYFNFTQYLEQDINTFIKPLYSIIILFIIVNYLNKTKLDQFE